MAIPDYQTVMLPLLQFAGDKQEHNLKQAVTHIAEHFKLTPEEKSQVLPSGFQDVITNRVGWARTYLKKAGLLEDPKRSFFKITARGLQYLSRSPKRIGVKDLDEFQEFLDFRNKKSLKPEVEDGDEEHESMTPEEALEYGLSKIHESLAGDIIDSVKHCTPSFFEHLVVELLVKMGYGGSRKEAGQVIGKSGDEGIDGIIKEDKLGLDTIYIQAKRWEGSVGRPEIQKFVGALSGQRAVKGIFITTSRFSPEAETYVGNIKEKVVLIDGSRLAQLMIENDVGVSTTQTIQIKKLDSDYFAE